MEKINLLVALLADHIAERLRLRYYSEERQLSGIPALSVLSKLSV